MDRATVQKVRQLRALVDETHDLWHDHDPDGHCKSSEGEITVSLGSYFDRREGLTEPRVMVYSYLFGPSRSHWFDSVDEALTTFKEWSDEYRAWLLCPHCGEPNDTGGGFSDEPFHCSRCRR